MTPDKKTVHLIIWIAFAQSVMNFLLYIFGIMVLVVMVKDLDATVIVALLAAAAGNLSSAGFLALLARTRTEPAPVTVENTVENPVPTEPQSPLHSSQTAPVEQVSPDEALPEPPPVAPRN